MLAALIKTAYSPNIKERKDCSAACFNSAGDLISLSAASPLHLSSLMGMVQNLKDKYSSDEIRKGDVFLTNDPYVGGGSHLPDLTVTSPVFMGDRLVAFVSCLAHHSDIGGKVAGSESADCTSIFQEGLRLPPVRLMDDKGIKQDIVDFILLNSRTPHHRDGDIKAQLASNLLGVRRIQELFNKFGIDKTQAGIEGMLDYAEARTREEINNLPDGVYENEDFIDHDGVEQRNASLKVAVTIDGNKILFDFSGSEAQVAGARNMVLCATLAGVYHAVKVICDPSLPPNAGYFRAIDVIAPPGSITNAVSPAAVGDRGATVNILGDVLLGALTKAAPERGIAGCGSRQGIVFSGLDPRSGEYFVDYEVYAGAAGALFDRDGMDAVRVHASVTENAPIEAFERAFPLVAERYELVDGSGGPGQSRGGLGVRLDILILAEDAHLAGRGLRQSLPAPGCFGGCSGSTGRFLLNPATESEQLLPSVFSDLLIRTGSVVRIETPSAGGFGIPLERDPQRVLADVLAGKVSPSLAKKDYNVVITDGSVDVPATTALRAK